ncbi:MAG TPA: sulfotransferase [Rhizomicrobium sp.]
MAEDQFSDETLDVVRNIKAAAESNEESRVYALASDALDRGFRHPMLFNARAIQLGRQGLYYDALVDIEAALAFEPHNPFLLKAAGECLLKLGVWQAACRAFGAAIESAPNMVQAHYMRGLAFQMNGQRQAAISSHTRAIELHPEYAEALGSLALISAAESKPENVELYAGRALALDPQQPTAHIALALKELGDGNADKTEQRLRDLLNAARFGDDPRANEVLREIGDRFDRMGNVPFAFAIYTEVNRKRRAIHERRFAGKRTSAEVALQTSYFLRVPPWGSSTVSAIQLDAPASHIFILGFARTGTTLLETVLASNDHVVAFDEKDCFPEEAKILLESEAGLDRLASLDEETLERLRNGYWEKMREFGRPAGGKVFVDKWPFNSRRLPLIARLFPDAKILFTIRDPRDVVLSCFRRSFIMNPDTFEFLDLEDCARLYSGIMHLVFCAKEKLPLNMVEVRYESVVADFDAQISRICSFIGLQWDEGMRDFARAADGTVDLYAQSGREVRRGLYSGAGQWRRFAHELAPAFPILQPWVEQFDYSTE